MTAPLCKACRHSIQDGSATWWACALTRTVSPVDGKDHYELCSIARVTPAQCGPAGVWFSPHPDAVDAEPPDQYNRSPDQESQL